MRFFRVLWIALALYGVLMAAVFAVIHRYPPFPGGTIAGRICEGLPLVLGVVPLYMVASFFGIFPRSRPLITVFFVGFLAGIAFLTGTLLTRLALAGVLSWRGDPWVRSEGAGAFLVVVGVILALLSRMRPPVVHRKTLFFPDLSVDLSGLTLLHMSDLHIGAWQSRGSLRRIAVKAASLEPDLLLYTGDIIDHREDEAARFTEIFGKLSGKLGTFAVLGNHEYWTLGARAPEIMKSAGVPLLRNESREVRSGTGSLFVAGIDDPAGSEGAGGGPDPEAAYRSVFPAPEDLVVTLVHQPTLWSGRIRQSSHITLSGHTHGGQIGKRSHRGNLASLFFPWTSDSSPGLPVTLPSGSSTSVRVLGISGFLSALAWPPK